MVIIPCSEDFLFKRDKSILFLIYQLSVRLLLRLRPSAYFTLRHCRKTTLATHMSLQFTL